MIGNVNDIIWFFFSTSNVMIGSAVSGIASGASAFARSRRSLAEPSNILPSNHLMTSSYYGRPASSSNSTTPGKIYFDYRGDIGIMETTEKQALSRTKHLSKW